MHPNCENLKNARELMILSIITSEETEQRLKEEQLESVT